MGDYALAISLGHNASAVAIRRGEILGGYEEERFTQIKADSVFPIRSINELMTRFNLPADTDCYIGHWFLDQSLTTSNKYWQRELLRQCFPGGGIYSLRPDFTHHDSHALSAGVFSGEFPTPFHIFVVDGFGSFGECYSVYESDGDDGSIKLVWRSSGFDRSIGLFYQYATAHCGMKMHQDEYKMLAYEPHIHERFSDRLIDGFDKKIERISDSFFNLIESKSIREASVSSLNHIRKATELELDVVDPTTSDRDRKIAISYIVQSVTERVMLHLFAKFSPKNLIVVGGSFYNVKVNSLLADLTPGLFSAMPLAGDQGAALGVYQEYRKDLQWPNHLFWGHRDLSDISLEVVPGIIVADDVGEMYDAVMDGLERDGIVNLVRGSMEYGPRALCNTSTLAIPSKANAEKINLMNNRTNEMPFGLVMSEGTADELFFDTNTIHRSMDYMIVSRHFRYEYEKDMMGGAHYYPSSDDYTCRPQTTSDPFMLQILNETGPLINTSFNFHGVPIVRGPKEILYTHAEQRKRFDNITTVVLRETK